ncbi:hypothetical protein [Bradyrhizobium sp. AUGA SZCCT0283]|uniref:hypothetical protein n=1 Tax=Bradyrhizobium sp. AUGA SZCCT0283 TaxID=2807671 RepID=UPI001BA5D5E9|nr:hypothetical protein [Bradyrhizobium sp. AUGA SZCCT0283]MBR1274139.1 hypothetical protein [Bradyrhizobium sp. AUGA SZCCT0283]
MNEMQPTLVENSFRIAWDYLEATGELGNPDIAAQHLLDTIEIMIRQGERRRLFLSNSPLRCTSGLGWSEECPSPQRNRIE